MADEHQLLKEWVINYLRSRDTIKKEIQDIVEQEGNLVIRYLDMTKKALIMPRLDNSLEIENHTLIITLNTKNNFEWMLDKWNKFITYDDLYIYFINPKINAENRWIISPYIHSKVSERSALKQGLISLFNSVPEYS